MAIAVVIAVSTASGAAGAPSPSASRSAAPEKCPAGSIPAGAGCIDAKPVRIIEKCPTARKAVKFYAGRVAYWRDKMGAGGHIPRLAGRTAGKVYTPAPCPRYLAHVLQRKAYGLRTEYGRWVEYHYHWWKWLPAKYQRVGRCETGGTAGATAAGNWFWDSGTYVSAFGIIRAAFPTWNGHNTPREQYEVAQSIQARYGWGAWGCGGA